jgi:flagellar motor switch protein FliM
MAHDRVLSQDEIDSVFRSKLGGLAQDDPARRAQLYDFRRPDRIAKDQLRAIHLLHETFTRSLASSLSAYLRAYVMVNLVSVEQLSFREFSHCLPSPTSIVSLSMKPYDGNAILEINPTIAFPILEMLLGGSGKSSSKVDREVTEIEQAILDGLIRILLHDLRDAWAQVTTINFAVENHETEPQLLQLLAPNEAVVSVGIEIRIGDVSGMMNLGVPSILVKMLRRKFDQQWSIRRAEASEEEQERMWRLLKPAQVKVDARLRGPVLSTETLLALEEGDVLAFDYPVGRTMDLLVNGAMLYHGEIVNTGRKRAFQIAAIHTAD